MNNVRIINILSIVLLENWSLVEERDEGII